jgi:hypothetical protein
MTESDVGLDLARRVTQRVAPDELPLLEETSSQHQLARGRRGRRGRRGSVLDFGIGDAVAVLSPVVIMVANAALNQAADRTGNAIIDGTAKLGRRLATVMRVRRRRKSASLVTVRKQRDGSKARLSVEPERTGELRRLVRRCARRARLPKAQARLIEEAFLAELTDTRERR